MHYSYIFRFVLQRSHSLQASWTNLKISRRHLVAPKVLLLPALVQRRLELLAQPLGVLAPLVLRHAEQDRSSICGCKTNWEIKLKSLKIFLRLPHQLHRFCYAKAQSEVQ